MDKYRCIKGVDMKYQTIKESPEINRVSSIDQHKQQAINNPQSDRQNYIDWLRVGAMFLLLFYHTGRLFDLEPWHIKNSVLNPVINAFNRFLDIWHMPLFFILAGASVWFALERRTPRAIYQRADLTHFCTLDFWYVDPYPTAGIYSEGFRWRFRRLIFNLVPPYFSGSLFDERSYHGKFKLAPSLVPGLPVRLFTPADTGFLVFQKRQRESPSFPA